MLQEIQVHIVGIAPILLKNGQTSDPLNKFAKAMKEVASKKKKTEADYAELSRIEWYSGLYVNDEQQLILPADVLDAAIVEGAKKSKLGKQFKSAVFVPYDAILDIGRKYTIDELWDDQNYRDVRGVRIKQNRVVRTRPIFRNWSAKFLVQLDTELVNLKEVMTALRDCGQQVGLCDYRPKYGRFEVKE